MVIRGVFDTVSGKSSYLRGDDYEVIYINE